MLTRNPDAYGTREGGPNVDPIMALFDIGAIIATLRRQWPLIAGFTAVFLLLGVGYLLTAAPKFTATTTMMIDTRKNQLLQSQQVVGDLQIDANAIESQIEILKSESVALSVIRDLKLIDDPEFNGQGSKGIVRTVLSALLPEGPPASEFQTERAAIGYFQRNLAIKRVGTSYAIDISYTSLNPKRAADIANAIADSYVVGELDAKYQATKRASRWLQDRMSELRTQASQADSAVQTFKAENNIVDTGRGLMSDQQLSDVNTQLVAARAATAETKARLDRIDQISVVGIPDATVADALKNDVINRLRAQFLDLSAREADWSARYGSAHTATINLRNQMREIQRSIADEVKRIAQTYRSDYEIARARESSLEASLSALVGQAAVTGQAQIKLRDLESTSQTYRNLYDNFLQRFMEATQQQTFPISEARVITAASEPTSKSAPKSALVLAGSLAIGALFGVGAAIARERLDNVIRTASQVQDHARMECLGVAPEITAQPQQADGAPADPVRRRLAHSLGLLRYVADSPFARFTETLRSAKVAIDIKSFTQDSRVIGITSALPNEGKTTISSNIAQLVAHTGQRAIILDGDLRNPSLTRALVPDAREGLLEVLSGSRSEDDLVWVDPVTGLHVLPVAAEGRISHTAEFISSQAMANLLTRLRGKYTYIFIDLPPVAPVVDVRAVSHLIDGFVLVIEWGRTTKEMIEEVIDGNALLRSRAVGAILNKANPAVLRRIENYKGRYYRSYYHENA